MSFLEQLRARFRQWGDRPAFVDKTGETTYRALSEWDVEPPPGPVNFVPEHHGAESVATLLSVWRRKRVAVFERAAWEASGSPSSHPLFKRLTGSGGFVVFTSGSTGEPKAILHDTETFLEKFVRSKLAAKTIPLLQWDHLGGLNTVFSQLSSGGTLYPPSSLRPEIIAALIEEHRIELLPATPSFLRFFLASEVHRRFDLSSLKRITYGTEVMPDALLSSLKEVFPKVMFRQTYGLSELGVLPVRSLESAWVKVEGPSVETKVIDGKLWIRARSAMLGYLNQPSPFEDGWMDTGDEVLEQEGHLRFLGRRSEIINVGGKKVFPSEVEEVIAQLPNVVEVAVAGEKNDLMGQVVTATIRLREPEAPAELRRRVRQHCLSSLAAYKVPFKVFLTTETLMTERLKTKRPREDSPCATS